MFMNTDTAVHLHRLPVGDDFALRARGSIGPDGIGVTTAEIFDRQGFIGTVGADAAGAAPAMIDELSWQFDLAWALADLHLAALSEDDFLWEPAPLCWTVRPDAAGVWRPDFADIEPDPDPGADHRVAHLAHRSVVVGRIDHLTGAAPRERTDVTMAG